MERYQKRVINWSSYWVSVKCSSSKMTDVRHGSNIDVLRWEEEEFDGSWSGNKIFSNFFIDFVRCLEEELFFVGTFFGSLEILL